MYLCYMKKILLLLTAFVSLTLSAQKDTKNFTPTNWVTDLGNFYTPEQEAKLNSLISDYEKKTSIEIGVVTIESLDGQSIEEFASEQFNRLGIGKKGADNGILVCFSLKDRKSRIEVGNGMEAFLSDATSWDALQVIKPDFRAQNYYEGTAKCLNYIIKDLGNEAYANRVKWLNEKRAKEAKEEAIAAQKAKDFLFNAFIVVLVFGILALIYYLDRERRKKIEAEKERIRLEELRKAKVKQNIADTKNYLTSIRVSDVRYDSSKLLKISKDSVDSKLADVLKQVNGLQVDSDDVYLSKLRDLKSIIDQKINSYNKLNSDYESDVYLISRLDSILRSAKSTNQTALGNLEVIKSYGYSKSYSDCSSYLDSLESEIEAVKQLAKTDLDLAIEKAKDLKSNIAYSEQTSSKVNSYLNEILSAKSKLENADSTIQSELTNITRYKKYLKTGELAKLEREYEEFRKKASNSSDYLALALIFATLLASITSLVSTLRRRKDDEEEQERRERRRREDEDRRRRDSYYSSSSSSWGSSSSSSSSSSSDSWGGFDGGSSSGGGASDGW